MYGNDLEDDELELGALEPIVAGLKTAGMVSGIAAGLFAAHVAGFLDDLIGNGLVLAVALLPFVFVRMAYRHNPVAGITFGVLIAAVSCHILIGAPLDAVVTDLLFGVLR